MFFVLLIPFIRWRRLRRAAFEGLNFKSSEVFRPVQEREAIRLSEALIKSPGPWMDHINRCDILKHVSNSDIDARLSE